MQELQLRHSEPFLEEQNYHLPPIKDLQQNKSELVIATKSLHVQQDGCQTQASSKTP